MADAAPLRILACWPYARHGWVAPLEGLTAKGHHVTYLGYRTPDEEPDVVAIPDARPRAFWHEFRNGRDVLRRLRPDRIVLMGTEGARQLSVVAAARDAGVPTAVLQHGVFGTLPGYLTLAGLVRQLGTPPARRRLPAAAFVARTLWRRPGELARALRYLIASARSTPWEAAPRHPLAARRADAYLYASTPSKSFHRAMDHVEEDRLVRVGLPEFDGLLMADLGAPRPDMALLIDTPHTGGPHGAAQMDGDEKAALLSRLAADLARLGWRLTVKLHPDSYADDWAVDGPHLRFVRDVDVAPLIEEATVVLGFDSTLLLPAMHHRPGVLLQHGPRGGGAAWFSELALSCGAVPSQHRLDEISGEAVVAAARDGSATAAGRARFVAELIGPPDGRSGERLERALRDLRVRA